MPNDDADPVVRVPQRAAETSPLLEFLDKAEEALKKASRKRQRLNARPIADTLFVYDSDEADETEAIEAFARIRYGVANPIAVSSWDEAIAEMAKYKQVRRLVLFTHGTPGRLMIGADLLSGDELAVRLKKAILTVTESVSFEGCSTMRDPAPMARAARAVQAPSAIGYTWWHYLLMKGYTLPKNGTVDAGSAKRIKSFFAKNRRFLIRPLRGGRKQIEKASELITELERRAKDGKAVLKVFTEVMRDGSGPPSRVKGDRARRSARKVVLGSPADVDKFKQQDLHTRPHIVKLRVSGVLSD